MKTGMLKMWLTMSFVSLMGFLLYYSLKDTSILRFEPDEIYFASMPFRLFGLLFMLTGFVAISLGGTILSIGWTEENSCWFIGVSIGLISVFVMFSSLTTYWIHILICLLGAGLYVALYIMYLSGSWYKKLPLSIFVFIFLVGFGVSVYILKNNIMLSVVSLASTYGLTLLAILINERVYFKTNKSLFMSYC
jgi:hypothetical protein